MTHTNYAELAKKAVSITVNDVMEAEISTPQDKATIFLPGAVAPEDFYVVWFTKTLKNWKALISTDLVSGHYFEVTHNGEKDETYVDWYTKQQNAVLSDDYLING